MFFCSVTRKLRNFLATHGNTMLVLCEVVMSWSEMDLEYLCNLKVHKQTTSASFNYRFLFFVNSGNCTIRFTSFLLSSFVRFNLTIGQRNLRKQCSKDTANLHVVLCRNFRQNTVLFFRSDRLHSGETVHVLRFILFFVFTPLLIPR